MSDIESVFFNLGGQEAEEADFAGMDEEFRGYVENILSYIKNSSNQGCNEIATQGTPEDIYSILISKEFNYQSKKNILHLKESSLHTIEENMKLQKPIPLYYSVGGGYKATIQNECLSALNFTLGLGELLIIYQVCRLEEKIRTMYKPGIKFYIIIDNGVANYVNSIPVDKTLFYVKLYEELIQKLGKSDVIQLIVQTRDMNWSVESKKIQIGTLSEISDIEYSNIQRFTGHECSREDAILSQARYNATMEFSGKLIRSYIGNEIWMLQYSNGKSLTFRPFPGGASRIQAGDIALKMEKEKVRPFLLSTKNYEESKAQKYACSLEQFLQEFLYKKQDTK